MHLIKVGHCQVFSLKVPGPRCGLFFLSGTRANELLNNVTKLQVGCILHKGTADIKKATYC